MNGQFLEETMACMSWPEVERLAGENALVLLPLGVIEEHGPHLCLGTDILVARMHCLRLREKLEARGCPACIAPPFYWGVCQSTGGFPGSFQIRRETAAMLLLDILQSLADFGFRRVLGVTGHNDIDHCLAVMDAFREAGEKTGLDARFVFDRERLSPFGLDWDAPFLCVVEPPRAAASRAAVPDVHAGDVETALIHGYDPRLADAEKAKALPPVELHEPEKWLFGGQIRELSPQGYLGAPAEFESVDTELFLEDYAERILEGLAL